MHAIVSFFESHSLKQKWPGKCWAYDDIRGTISRLLPSRFFTCEQNRTSKLLTHWVFFWCLLFETKHNY